MSRNHQLWHRKGIKVFRRYNVIIVSMLSTISILASLWNGDESFDSEGALKELANGDNAIFYDLFAPLGPGRNSAVAFSRSFVAVIQDTKIANTKLFITVIGDASLALEYCEEMNNCRVVNRMIQGDDKITLTDAFNYCRENLNSSITYLHSTGFASETEENTRSPYVQHNIRALIQTQTCRESVQQGTCNVCSARVLPLPYFHYLGNMWTARCSYVKKLTQPNLFEGQMARVGEALRQDRDSLNELFPCREGSQDCVDFSHMGMQSLSSQHWILSHPSVIPCDVLPNESGNVRQYNPDIHKSKTEGPQWMPQLNVGPRYSLEESLKEESLPKAAKWFSLRGRLFEWNILFGQIPPANSWIWEYYSRSSFV
jgi:hypothetical protein